jgi:hypothetical protein
LDERERGHKAYDIEQACAAECCSPRCAALLALFNLGLPRGSLRVKHSLGIVKLVTPLLPWPSFPLIPVDAACLFVHSKSAER